jgi:hypothetical protein
MKKGFILVEVLISMVIVGQLIILISSISNVLMNLPKIAYVTQLDMFKLQMDQLLSISKNHEIVDNSLCFDLDLRRFCLESEKNRLVKKPGYEIVLVNIRDIRWEINDHEIVLNGFYEEKPFVFEFKLTERVYSGLHSGLLYVFHNIYFDASASKGVVYKSKGVIQASGYTDTDRKRNIYSYIQSQTLSCY